MPQDMVASVTLMLRDQMGAGIDEIKAQLAGLKPTLDGLTGVLGDLDATLKQLKMPVAFNDSLKNTANQAGIAAKAVASIGDAAQAADAKLKDLAIPAMPGVADAPGIYNPAIPDAFHGPMQVPGMPGWIGGGEKPTAVTPGEGHHPADALTEFMGDAIMAAIGVESVKSRAEFNNLNLHSAITERYTGERARQQQRWIDNDLDRLALKYRQSSNELAEAYYYLVTTHMKPALINALMPVIAKTATAYNSSPQLMGAAAFAMSDSFKISASQMSGALAAMAWAAKNSHFSIESMGHFLPVLGGTAATMGMTGRKNLDQVMAMVETIRKNVNQPQEAAHDLVDLMNSISSVQTAERFSQNLYKRAMNTERPLLSKYHIKPVDIWKIEQDGVKKGESPLMAVLNYLHGIVKPMNAVDKSAFINSVFSGQGAGMAVKSILLHWDSEGKLAGNLDKVGPKMLDTDFRTAMKGSATVVRHLNETVTQLNRGLGGIFLPAVRTFGDVVGKIELLEHPKLPQKMSAKERQDFLSGHPFEPSPLPPLIKSLTSAIHDNTRAAKSVQASYDRGQGMGAHVNAHPTSPVGPVLNRP
jgi:TP901 family phage tail tape measure protein